ncbi:type 1 glutamine amidotransferase [Pseudonocardia sp. N23]|uniref:type 1 glutamine amidotransferase n=1 Tax=Pseudonocardia sp. N23 TaxID=1987376 RepID=UPI000BFD9EF2|nr:type 1 glutamine amidotransferase [Pseudonocardia sp. N23]GAY09147.1 glutamine amidotransferase class-I [Pseudonocardia sp. N23]
MSDSAAAPDSRAAEDTILVVQHQDDAGPGNLGEWLTDNGLPWELVDASTDTLPAPARFRALVVLGSREAAYDDTIPWLAAEKDFVRETMALGTPVFGICFGAQLLAILFGGNVQKASTIERGWIPISPSVDPADDDYAELVDSTWFEWHGDEITAPGSATIVSRGSCVQAFRRDGHLGVQFHPEVTETQLVQWMDSDRRLKLLAEAGGERADLLADTATQLPEAIAAAHRLYSRFFLGA